MSILDTLTPRDEIVIALVRQHDTVITDLHPRDPVLAEIREEVESHMPGYEMKSDYGIFEGTRGCKLRMLPDEVTVLDAFYDGFQSYAAKHDLA